MNPLETKRQITTALGTFAAQPLAAAANRLRLALQRREVHGDVLRFCRAELIQDTVAAPPQNNKDY